MVNANTAQPPLMAAKLFQPLPAPNRVERRHLVQRLDEGLAAGRPVTLVSAPAGYGKSTLVAEWAAQTMLPVTWLSLDEADDDPLRFLSYLVAALQRVDDALGKELERALQAGQVPPPEVVVTSLTNDVMATKVAFACVLDDFQAIQDAAIGAVLNGLVARQPSQFHLVIVTREDPPLPLARLRARNQLTEIRASDLRFVGDEIDLFMTGVMGLSLSPQEITRLEERTEGWIAGLQLAGLSMQGRPDPAGFVSSLSGSHRYILSYLTEEVLKRQTAETQDFLLQTAILSRLTGSLCDAVTGQAGSANLLESLLAANLFLIPLDDEQCWYRYHHLFADLLLNQLRRTRPGQEAELHRRASRWYEDQHMLAETIEHALAAGDFARVGRLLELHTWALLNQGYVRRVEAWIQALPPDWRAFGPRTSLGFAWLHMLRGNFGQVAVYLKQAEAALALVDPGGQDITAMQAECLALQSNLMQVQGKVGEAVAAARGALQLVAPGQLRVTGLAYLGLGAAYRQAADFDQAAEALQSALRASQASADLVTGMLAVSHLTLMALQHGRLRFAAETASQAIAWMERAAAAPPPIVGAVYGALGLVFYEWNQIDVSRDQLLRGIRLGTFSGHNASVIYSKVTLARLQQAEGDLEAAQKTLAEAAELFQLGAPGWVRPGLVARQANLFLARNDLAAAEAALCQSGVAVQDAVSQQSDEIHLAWLRLLYRRGTEAALRQGLELAQRSLAATEAGRRNGMTLQVLVLGAQVCAALGQAKTGLAWLERALALAEPEGYLRLFVDEGPPLAALLQRLPGSEYACKLLALFPVPEAPAAGLTGEQQLLEGRLYERLAERLAEPLAEPLVEPLTERELEVLRLLAQGLKYTEIAARLVVSVNTVRFHVKGIYGKLGVDKQARAIEVARQLKLI